MGSNSFGTIFRITTWGESHGKSIGVIIDGCPAGLKLTREDIQQKLGRRRPGQNSYTSPRKEMDEAEIHSGLFEGQTTGAPIAILLRNSDADPSPYDEMQHLLRPGHAQFTYLEKYGLFDHRGGGRASARETACRVAAGAVAQKLLEHVHIGIAGFLYQIGTICCDLSHIEDFSLCKEAAFSDPLFCPDREASQEMQKELDHIKASQDSIGGIVGLITTSLPAGLGDPVYEKLEANLAKAMLSIPASRGIEFGSGFRAATMRGSENNDLFALNEEGKIVTSTNHAGGILGGISTGMPLNFRVAFKPTSSIKRPQTTLDRENKEQIWQLPTHARHDPCVAIRAVPVVEAMAALVLADALLLQQTTRLDAIGTPVFCHLKKGT